MPVPATDGKTHLAYELQLTNTLDQEVTLTSVAVHAGDKTLLTLAGDKLGYWTRVFGTPDADDDGWDRPRAARLARRRDGHVAPLCPLISSHTVGVTVPKPTPPLIPAVMDEKVAPVVVLPSSPSSSRRHWTAQTGWTATVVAT